MPVEALSTVKIFAGSGSRFLGEKIAKAYGKELGEMQLSKFSDGELSVAFNESIRGSHIFLIQSTCAPADNLMELLLMIDAAKRASAKYATVVIPYFGYARQDRKDRPRVAIAAKLKANLISAAGADRMMTCDLHAGQIQGFFDIPVDHLDASVIFKEYIAELNLENPVFASPDVGGSARARRYAKMFAAEMVICDKHRKRANEVASMQVIGDVKGADVILVDDIVDTAGTICKAADIIKEKGAKSVRAVCTHAILSGNAYEKIKASALEEMVVTDSITLKKESDKLQVKSVAGLFATAIRKTHDHESISTLFV